MNLFFTTVINGHLRTCNCGHHPHPCSSGARFRKLRTTNDVVLLILLQVYTVVGYLDAMKCPDKADYFINGTTDCGVTHPEVITVKLLFNDDFNGRVQVEDQVEDCLSKDYKELKVDGRNRIEYTFTFNKNCLPKLKKDVQKYYMSFQFKFGKDEHDVTMCDIPYEESCVIGRKPE